MPDINTLYQQAVELLQKLIATQSFSKEEVGTADIIEQFLKEKGITTFAAELSATKAHYLQDFKQGTAVVVGTEATGLSPDWREASTKNIIIPMQGEIDSMNVSVAAAILIFEAKRQRGF